MSHQTEQLLTVSQVCRKYPGARGAKNLTPSTVTRWILSGCPARDGTRVRLAATRCGARWLVAPAALSDFFAALASGDSSPLPEYRSPAARRPSPPAASRSGRSPCG